MKFDLEKFHRDIPESELLADLRRANEIVKSRGRALSFRSYNEVGQFSAATFGERFGSWNKALAKAGISPAEEKNVSIDSLFENLRNVWLHKGKQPVFRDMAAVPSKYSASLYAVRFGSWRTALRKFVAYVNSDEWTKDSADLGSDLKNRAPIADSKRRTSRSISERMRFRILLRDGFECQSCGASPLKDRGIELHVDHILPWSEGGETEDDNLQTKCARCNLGKGNAFKR